MSYYVSVVSSSLGHAAMYIFPLLSPIPWPPRGRPPKGPGGAARTAWATAAAAVGPGRGGGQGGGGRGGDRLGWGHIRILYKAPKDYIELQKITQSPNRLYKALTDYTKPRQTIQSP